MSATTNQLYVAPSDDAGTATPTKTTVILRLQRPCEGRSLVPWHCMLHDFTSAGTWYWILGRLLTLGGS